MKNKLNFVLVVILLYFFVLPVQSQNLEELMFELPDIIFQEIEPTKEYGTTYKLKIKQPLDHFDLSKGHFYQKVFLTHRGFEQPIVMNTCGYDRSKDYIHELTKLLGANQLNIEHRYFGESIPDSLDYKYLNLTQITADLHYINQLFKKIYSGKWISTGISKGGSTTIFYRYFYPNDVDVSIPYVAPLTMGFEDKRIYTFLDTIGSKDCHNKIESLQINLFENREQVLPLLKFYSIGKELDFSYLTPEQAFEYAVLEYPFSFWQSGYSCDSIPDEEASINEIVEYFVNADILSLYSDESIDKYGSHYYQAATEMGYYGYDIDDFKEYIVSLPNDKNPHATFPPKNLDVKFDDTLLKKVNKWLINEGNKFIYIYGSIDTWSACAVKLSKNVDSKAFYLEGKNHYKARIKNMNEEERQEFISTLENWLSLDIEE